MKQKEVEVFDLSFGGGEVNLVGFLKDFSNLLLERGEGREKARNISVQEIH